MKRGNLNTIKNNDIWLSGYNTMFHVLMDFNVTKLITTLIYRV